MPAHRDSHFFVGVKVVILHQHFKVPFRGGAIRSWYLARALTRAGHQVTVVTGHNGSYKVERIKDIEVHWLPVAYDNRFNFATRSRSFLKFVYQVIRRPSVYRDAALCYAISVPLTTGLAAMWIKKRHGVPYIFEVGDLWPDAPVELGFITNRRIARFLHGVEKKIYARARCIVALSEPIGKAVRERAVEKTVVVIPNMADLNYYMPSRKDQSLKQEYGLEGKIVVSYIGALGYANGLEYMLACAEICRAQEVPVAFLICGDGAEAESLRLSAQHKRLDNVRFIPFQTREGVKKILDVTDVVFVCYRPVAILETGSPNKYFDGLAAGKMIIANFSGWIREEVEREACGIYVDPGNAGSFVANIKSFIDDPTLLGRYQENARRLAERKYSRDELSRKFVDVVEKSAAM